MDTVDQLHYAVTRITTHYYEDDRTINPDPVRVGTGFFYSNLTSQSRFLITNRHVIINENEDYFPNFIRVRLHTDMTDVTENEDYDIPLYDSTKKLWRESTQRGADMVAIPVDVSDLSVNGMHAVSFASNNLLPSEIQLHLNDDVFVLGYPLDIFDRLHNLPSAIGGTLASPYPLPWNGNPYFLLNASLDKGTSGSPVITKFKSSWKLINGQQRDIGYGIFLLGINSSTFPAREGDEPKQMNAAYFATDIEYMTR
jgi:hypothetical protein